MQSIILSCTMSHFGTGLFQGFGALAILETVVRAANDLEVFIITFLVYS